MTGTLQKLNCTQCGAGLDVLGGGRVLTHVCSYCGAELDAQDDYKVVAQFRDMPRPRSPFDLGMTGAVWGVDFTVIGTIAWQEYHAGRTWSWVDHQIYSPTHGYAWLSVEDGHVTFTRKTRDIPRPALVSARQIETSETRPSVRLGGERFLYYASGRAKPTFIEGEFNFRPSLDDTADYVTLLGDTQMLDILASGSEVEYEMTHLPDQADLLTSFGVDAARMPKPGRRHPLDFRERPPIQLFLRNLAIGAAAASIALAFLVSLRGETVAVSGKVPVSVEVELPFTVTSAEALTEITIWSNANNSWAWFEAELVDGAEAPVAAFERGVEYYSGSDWSEGSQKARTRLRLEEGDYTLSLAMSEADVDWTGGVKASQMEASVRVGVANPWWLAAAGVLFGVIGAGLLAQNHLARSGRWTGSDWDDD